MLTLYLQAPFAAFRAFTAGWYRQSATFLTPSAAYGLALNLAGIESRRDDDLSAMTVTAFDLPAARIAIGADPTNPSGPHPAVHTLFQQLHNYPVGASGKERKDDTKGNKYNITPVRREFLSDLRAFVCLDFFEDRGVEDRIRDGIEGATSRPSRRYGLPFLGDNAFLLDKIELRDQIPRAHWYRQLDDDTSVGWVSHSTRLTIWIDRQDMSKTISALYAPDQDSTIEIPKSAWTEIHPPTSPKPIEKKSPKRKGVK